MESTRYECWHEWVDDAGRLYADPHHFDTLGDAKRAHSGALTFAWAAGKERPSVSDLYAVTMTRDESDPKARARLSSRVSVAKGKRLERLATLT